MGVIKIIFRLLYLFFACAFLSSHRQRSIAQWVTEQKQLPKHLIDTYVCTMHVLIVLLNKLWLPHWLICCFRPPFEKPPTPTNTAHCPLTPLSPLSSFRHDASSLSRICCVLLLIVRDLKRYFVNYLMPSTIKYALLIIVMELFMIVATSICTLFGHQLKIKFKQIIIIVKEIKYTSPISIENQLHANSILSVCLNVCF